MEAAIAARYVNRTEHPSGRLWLLNDSNRTVWERAWDAVTTQCRGLIMDRDGQIVARPFDPWFNLGEVPETEPQALPTTPFEATVKLDGSLGILSWLDDEPCVATRGSFTSPQAVWATRWLRDHGEASRVPRDVTRVFEIMSPENRVVHDDAGSQGLTLIGARPHGSGTDEGYAALRDLADQCGLAVVPMFPVQTLDDRLSLQSTTTGAEGWVIRWPSGFRVKIKPAEYLHLHRLIAGLTPAWVQEHGVEALASMPEEFRQQGEAWEAHLVAATAAEVQRLPAIMRVCQPLAEQGRTGFAPHVIQHAPDDRAHLVALLDGRDSTAKVRASVDAARIGADQGGAR